MNLTKEEAKKALEEGKSIRVISQTENIRPCFKINPSDNSLLINSKGATIEKEQFFKTFFDYDNSEYELSITFELVEE